MNETLEHLGLRHRVLEQQALTRWGDVVGPHNAAASVAESIHDGVLFVACKSSMWANELSLHKEWILKRLNKALGKNVVKDIRFCARGFKRAKEPGAKEGIGEGSKGLEAVRLSDKEAQKARAIASASPSPELAERIERAVLTSKRRVELNRQ